MAFPCVLLPHLWLSFFLRGAIAASLRSTSRSSISSEGFRYQYQMHGQDWSDGQCGSRSRQSPIDIPFLKAENPFGEFFFQYDPITAPFDIKNDGHTYQLNMEGLGYGGVSWQNSLYALVSLEIHAFSEHTFRGVHYPLELQIVHKKSDSDALLTVSVPISAGNPWDLALLQEDARHMITLQTSSGVNLTAAAGSVGERLRQAEEHSNCDGAAQQDSLQSDSMQFTTTPAFTTTANPCAPKPSVTGYLPPPCTDFFFNPNLQKFLATEPPLPLKTKQVPMTLNAPFDINTFLTDATFWEYTGSKTAPPCSEIVTWLVRSEPIHASNTQIAYLLDGMFRLNSNLGNYRKTMPRLDRQIKLRTAVHGQPVFLPSVPNLPPPRGLSQREKTAEKWSQEALSMAKTAADSVKDFDFRLRAAAAARNNPMPVAPATTTTLPSTTVSYEAKVAVIADVVAYSASAAVKQALSTLNAESQKVAEQAAKEAVKIVATQPNPGGGILPTQFPPPPTTTLPMSMALR